MRRICKLTLAVAVCLFLGFLAVPDSLCGSSDPLTVSDELAARLYGGDYTACILDKSDTPVNQCVVGTICEGCSPTPINVTTGKAYKIDINDLKPCDNNCPCKYAPPKLLVKCGGS